MKLTSSIKTKLILILAALVVIPVAALTIISTIISFRQGTDNANEVNIAQAQLVTDQLDTIYSSNLEALKAFAASPETIAYLEGSMTGEAVEEDLMRQMLQIDADQNDGNATALSGADGEQRLRTIGKTVNVADREYFQVPASGADQYISDMIVSKSTGSAIITFSVPVFNIDRTQFLGIVQRNYDVSVLHDLLASDVTQDRQEIVIVDRTGTVVAHSLREVDTENPETQEGNPFYTDSRGDKTSGQYVSDFMGDTWIISWNNTSARFWCRGI